MPLKIALPLLLPLLLVAGCTSTPQASPAADEAAKAFRAEPGTAALYVYRPDRTGDFEQHTVLYLDDRVVGETLPQTYFRIDVPPGRHVLHGIGHDTGRFALDARAGEVYFVAQNPIGGLSDFKLIGDAAARREIRQCCALLENWAPGQRPLLR